MQDEKTQDLNQQEYVDTLLKIINVDLPIISKYNIHLYQNILSAIELVLDQSYNMYNNLNEIQITEETKSEVNKIISEIELKE